ncbi:sigma-54 dependent transcriptional regulator [Photobacterium rosenbergii]|uniref:Sigma-54 dependent transcriptional regulator n=1 Tax=Photobacterium rosenbergii TaxID=294936 RepID=A0ABU3ZL21_9GAMM|nr:sigma-54 dependent transcriptional regulator [Photobacterium rosenbergii]MDV5170795.1 sigma-54 dependent transcriptional regulator [Photobacterium rosenbergii]
MRACNVIFAHRCLVQAASAIKVLSAEGYTVRNASTAADALAKLREQPDSLLFVADNLTDMDMLSTIRRAKQMVATGTVVAIVDYQQSKLASDAMQAGADDYLLQPYQPEQIIALLERNRTVQSPKREVVATSRRSLQVLQMAHRAAQTDATVLITGESGTGKEVLARYVHDHSPRSEGPFVAINCAAIPESMLEAVLFGHTKGAFTGATQSQAGKFEEANGGTLLLDEVGEMPPALQAKLLRVLQERQVERLGSHRSISLDIRIIAATNVDLQQAVAERRFRQDLYYRLDVLPLQWPPLRDRKEDILPLAEHFIRKLNAGCTDSCSLSEEAQLALQHYNWPGNIRELENTIQRALVMRHGHWITAQDLMLNDMLSTMVEGALGEVVEDAKQALKQSRKNAEQQFILDTLARFKGKRNDTAEALGMSTRALRYKIAAMREQGINIDSYIHQSGNAA